MRKKVLIFLITILIIGISIPVINVLLQENNWYLRDNILLLSFVFIHIGIIGLLIYAILKIKNETFRIIILDLFLLISLLITIFNFFIFALVLKPNPIKIIDETQYIGEEHKTNRLRKDVYYYEEYNIFAYHKTNKYIEEFYDYDNYKQPKFRVYNNIKNEGSTELYYNENGKVVRKIIYDKDRNTISDQIME